MIFLQLLHMGWVWPVGSQDIVSRKKIKKFKSYPQKKYIFLLPLWDNNIRCNYNKKKGQKNVFSYKKKTNV